MVKTLCLPGKGPSIEVLGKSRIARGEPDSTLRSRMEDGDSRRKLPKRKPIFGGMELNNSSSLLSSPFATGIYGLYCTRQEVSTVICTHFPRAQSSYRRMSRVVASWDLQFF